MLTRVAALCFLFFAGCIHTQATFPLAGIRDQLATLRDTGGTEIPGARPRDARLSLDDRVTIPNGDDVTVRELVAPCLLRTSDAPDGPRCPLTDQGAAVRVTEDPGMTLLVWSAGLVITAAIVGLIGCIAACQDVGWQITSGIALGGGLLAGTIALLSLLGP